MAMTPPHFAAYILDPKFRSEGLLEESAMIDVVKFRAMTFPFKEYLFRESVPSTTSVNVWWRSLGSRIDRATLELTNQLYTATASSAGIERLFSTFGLVHSQLRNRLGTKKAAKLVSIMRVLNPAKKSRVEDDH